MTREPRALGQALRDTERVLTSELLFAAQLSPLVAWAMGWPVHTPLEVSLGVHLLLLTSFAALYAAGATRSPAGPLRGVVVRCATGAILAGAVAVVLRERANAFYTASSLMNAMGLLLVAHLLLEVMRTGLLARRELSAKGRMPLSALPAVTLADLLTRMTGWAVLASWVLIWFSHRHVVIPILLLGGAFQALALVVLVPDALAVRGWLPETTVVPIDDEPAEQEAQPFPPRLRVVRGALAERPSADASRPRRSS